MGKYIIDGTILLGGGEKLYGDPDSGEIVYLPDGKLTDEEIARMVAAGFLRTPAAALSAEALQAHLDELQAQQADLLAQLAEAQAAAAPTTKGSKKSAASDSSTDTPPSAEA